MDPTILLNTIVYLLDHNGGLKNDRVVRQFITYVFLTLTFPDTVHLFRLMKLAEKLVNKSIYLQILSHTKSDEILQAYVDLNH